MSRLTKRSSQRAIDAFLLRVAVGDMYEATANDLDLTASCVCGRRMRPRVGRCATCAAAEVKLLGVDVLSVYRSDFKVQDGCVVRNDWRRK